MFGLFGKLGEKVINGVLDVAIAGIDVLDKATDVLIETTDKMIDKSYDIRSTVEDMIIETEYQAKSIKSSVQGIKEYSKTEYGRKTYLQEEVNYMRDGIKEYKKGKIKIILLIKVFNSN